MSLKDFKIINKLGEGAYSCVYRVIRIIDGEEYALKKVKLLNLSEKEKQNALNEVRILASIRDNNIISYKEVFIDESSSSLCIVMEYADNGDLFQKIVEHQKSGYFMNENEIWSILIQIVKGLKCLHQLKVLHRDLKSANVFLTKDGSCKLGDMNVSKIAKKGLLYTQTGTPYYASPEVWKDQPYDQKSDIWSLGCVLYEMVTLKPPFRAEDMEGLYKKVIRGYYPKIPGHFSQDLNNLIHSLLQVSSHMRPSCEKILQLPSVIKRLEERHLLEADEGNPIFLNTIKFPKNLHYLTERLPGPNYEPLKVKRVDKAKFVQTVGAKVYDSDRDEENSFEKYKKNPENSRIYKKPQPELSPSNLQHKDYKKPQPELSPSNLQQKDYKKLQPELSPSNLQQKDDTLPEINPSPMKKKYKKKNNINHQVSVKDLELRLANKNKRQEKPEEKSLLIKNDRISQEVKEPAIHQNYDKQLANIQNIYGVEKHKLRQLEKRYPKKKPHSKNILELDIEGESKPLLQKYRKNNNEFSLLNENIDQGSLPPINHKPMLPSLNVKKYSQKEPKEDMSLKINQIVNAYKGNSQFEIDEMKEKYRMIYNKSPKQPKKMKKNNILVPLNI